MSGKRPRKSEQSVKQKFAFTSTVRDDPTLEIASYSNKPFGGWNTSLRDKYGCTPNSKSYKVLGKAGAPCPLEAKLADPDDRLCCTSRVKYRTHQESLDFFKYLKTIYYHIPINLRTLDHIPPSLRRLVRWISSNDNTSEIRFVGYTNVIFVNTEHERFLEIVKFALMSKSQVVINAVQNTGAPLNSTLTVEVYNNNQILVDDRLVDRHGVSLFDELVRITNDTGEVSAASFTVRTPPATTVSLPLVNGRNLRFGIGNIGSVFAVDLSDIVSLLVARDNNGWNTELVTINHRVVTSLPANLTLNDLMLPLFNALINQSTYRNFKVFTGAPPNHPDIVVPPGFRPITIAPNEVTDLANVLSASVNGTNFVEMVPGEYYRFRFVTPVGRLHECWLLHDAALSYLEILITWPIIIAV